MSSRIDPNVSCWSEVADVRRCRKWSADGSLLDERLLTHVCQRRLPGIYEAELPGTSCTCVRPKRRLVRDSLELGAFWLTTNGIGDSTESVELGFKRPAACLKNHRDLWPPSPPVGKVVRGNLTY